MSVMTSGNIKILSALKLKYVTALRIVSEANKHGLCMVKGVLEDGAEAGMILNCQKDIPVSVIASGEDNLILFRGIVNEAELFIENGFCCIKMNIVTASEMLDKKKNYRSFQDKAMTYKQAVERVMEPYGGNAVRFVKEAESTLNEPLIQYGETDWEFLLRVGSRLHIPLYADCFTGNPDFDFGMREGRMVRCQITDYHVGVNDQFYKANADQAGIAKGGFLYYIIVSDEAFMIGDYIDMGRESYPIFKKCVSLDREEVKYTYWIGNMGNWYIPRIPHTNLRGTELTGTVVQTREEKVRVRFDIDGARGGAEHEWDWQPASGNIMYSMPEQNTSVRVCFGSETASEGIATENIRANGAAMPSVQERTFTTAAGKRICLHPSKMTFQGKGGEAGLFDQERISLSGAGNIKMTAAGTIRIRASKIHAQTPLEINMYRSEAGSRERQKDIAPKGTRSNPPTGGSDSGFTMNFAFDGLSKSGVLCGCEFIRYRPFLDAPEEIALDDSAFDWGALVGNVIGGLTIVAAVTALAAYGATVVFTGGASAVFAPWVVGGLTAICGGAFVFGQAEKDMEMKKVSKFSTYAGGSIVNSLKGAFAAAAFCMVPYAAEGMVYSVVPAAAGGLSVGCMFISTDAMIALTGTVGYTITFSNMAVKASDSLEGVVGTNVMENMVGEEGYQKIAEASQSGSEIIFMMGLMNPDLYVKNQRVTNIRQVAAYDNSGGGSTTVSNWENKISDLSEQAPIEIPSSATVKVQAKNGYDQITFKWEENGQNYEVRWHTKTPGAPEGQGNTWVISRVTPGTPTGQVRTEHILDGDMWIPRYQWQEAINAYRNGTATAEQLQLLKDGHWQAP